MSGFVVRVVFGDVVMFPRVRIVIFFDVGAIGVLISIHIVLVK